MQKERGPLSQRDGRLEHSRRAAIALFKFAIATIVGYLIWSALLWRLDPVILIVNTFGCLFLFYMIGKQNRKYLFSINKGILTYTIIYALSMFAYWGSFWVGIYVSGSASLALAMLALTMVVTPLMVRGAEEPEDRSSLKAVTLTGIVVLSAIVLIELNVDTPRKRKPSRET